MSHQKKGHQDLGQPDLTRSDGGHQTMANET